LSGQILTGQESRGEISKTRLTLLLTVLEAEGGRQRGAGNGIEALSFWQVIVAITRSFGSSDHRPPFEVSRLLAPTGATDLLIGQSSALDKLNKPLAHEAMNISRTEDGGGNQQ
jgi:hypothetical protein